MKIAREEVLWYRGCRMQRTIWEGGAVSVRPVPFKFERDILFEDALGRPLGDAERLQERMSLELAARLRQRGAQPFTVDDDI